MDTVAVASASTALVGAVLGSPVAPLVQERLQQRSRLHNERMSLYTEAMLQGDLIRDTLPWLTDPYETRGTTLEEIEQRRALKKVPDQITSQMRLIAHKRVKVAWLDLLQAEEGLDWSIREDYAGFRQEGSDPMEALPHDYRPVLELSGAIQRFEQSCRAALQVGD